MSFPTKQYAFDAATGLVKRDVGQTALTANGYVGTQWDQGANVATDCILIANIESIDISSNDEIYKFTVLGSQTADRSDAEIIGKTEFGDAGTVALETRDAAVGDRVEIPFRTEKNGQSFRYVDLYLQVVGTTPSIGFNAYITKEIS